MPYKKGTRIGSFVLEEVLSEHGGTAAVYRATMLDAKNLTRHSKSVALKISHVGEEDSDVYESLLIKETDLLHDLRHPGIVRLYPITQFNKIQFFARAIELATNPTHPIDAPWYFVMELLPKETLADRIADKKLSTEWRLELIYQLATIIDYLHLRQIAHLDLKPNNVLFRFPPQANQLPTPVLIDFGLAEKRRLKPDVTASTLAYSSPERVQWIMDADKASQQIDHLAADIWALGVICYELLTQKYPFADKTQRTALAHRLMNEQPEPMPETIPPRIHTLILDMLEKDPQKRPTIEQVITRLETQIEVLAPRL